MPPMDEQRAAVARLDAGEEGSHRGRGLEENMQGRPGGDAGVRKRLADALAQTRAQVAAQEVGGAGGERAPQRLLYIGQCVALCIYMGKYHDCNRRAQKHW